MARTPTAACTVCSCLVTRHRALSLPPSACLLQEAPVDVVDDLHVPRQQLLHHRHRPLLQRLGQHAVRGLQGKGTTRTGDHACNMYGTCRHRNAASLHAKPRRRRACSSCKLRGSPACPPHVWLVKLQVLVTSSQDLVQPRCSWSMRMRISSGTAQGQIAHATFTDATRCRGVGRGANSQRLQRAHLPGVSRECTCSGGVQSDGKHQAFCPSAHLTQQGRMGVVHLEGHLVGEVLPIAMHLLVAAHHILEGQDQTNTCTQ